VASVSTSGVFATRDAPLAAGLEVDVIDAHGDRRDQPQPRPRGVEERCVDAVAEHHEQRRRPRRPRAQRDGIADLVVARDVHGQAGGIQRLEPRALQRARDQHAPARRRRHGNRGATKTTVEKPGTRT
jgi:hypothetical protein